MLILLPPSEGKNGAPGAGAFQALHPDLASDTIKVLEWLLSWSDDDLCKRLKVKDLAKARAMHQQNLAVLDAPGIPALDRYTGVVYENMGLEHKRIRVEAEKRVLIVSGLFGLIPGNTSIPDYKLPISPWLLRYWNPINTSRITPWAKDKPVLDLLPKSHEKALAYPHRISVDFRVAGGAKAAGHFGKAIKGRFVQWLLKYNVQDTAEFWGFREEGYRWDGANFVQH